METMKYIKSDFIYFNKFNTFYNNSLNSNKLNNLHRNYSTYTATLPLPIFTLNDLQNRKSVISQRNMLYNKGGIYSFINKIKGKQYIGSAKDLYLRLNEHLSGRKSNKALQLAFSKYGLENFNFLVYEYFTYIDKSSSNKLLTDLESLYIKKFKFEDLYNFMKDATSLAGYIHTNEAKAKMVKRLEDKTNHPF
jgi:hypothetical protein